MTQLPTGVSVARANLGFPDRFQRLGKELEASGLGLNVVLLRPGQRMRVHRHRHQQEIYLVVHGRLTLQLESIALELEVLDVARVAPEVRRQLINAGDELCAVVAIGIAPGDHESRDAEAFDGWADTIPRQLREVPLPSDLPPAHS